MFRMIKIYSDRHVSSRTSQEEEKLSQFEFLSRLKEQQVLRFFLKQLYCGRGILVNLNLRVEIQWKPVGFRVWDRNG